MIRPSDILRGHALEETVADHSPYRPLIQRPQGGQDRRGGHVDLTCEPRRLGVFVKRGGTKRAAEPFVRMQEEFAGSSSKRRIGSLDSFVRLQGRQRDGGEVDLREVHLFVLLFRNVRSAGG